MLSLQLTKNGCGSAHGSETAPLAARAGAPIATSPVGAEGGVGKPAGFTNTSDDPRAGGHVVLPGGFANRLRAKGEKESDFVFR